MDAILAHWVSYHSLQSTCLVSLQDRQHRTQVSTCMVHHKACCLLPYFTRPGRRPPHASPKDGLGPLSNESHMALKSFHETEQKPKHILTFIKDKIIGKIHVAAYAWISSLSHNHGHEDDRCLCTNYQHQPIYAFCHCWFKWKEDAPHVSYKGCIKGRMAKDDFFTYPDCGHYTNLKDI